jgi:hypothetical protein
MIMTVVYILAFLYIGIPLILFVIALLLGIAVESFNVITKEDEK